MWGFCFVFSSLPWYVTHSNNGRKMQKSKILLNCIHSSSMHAYIIYTHICIYVYIYSLLQTCHNVLEMSYCLCTVKADKPCAMQSGCCQLVIVLQALQYPVVPQNGLFFDS